MTGGRRDYLTRPSRIKANAVVGQGRGYGVGRPGQFSGGLGDAIKGVLGGLGGGGGLGGILSGIGGLFSGGFADGGMNQGAGSGTSDSNLAMVSDGEFIVNAGATARNKALLTAINSGKAPRFGASIPTVSNVVNRTTGASVTNHYTVQNNISTPNADSFRKSSGQIMSDASVHLHGWVYEMVSFDRERELPLPLIYHR